MYMPLVEVDQAVAPPPKLAKSEEQMTLPEASVVSLPPLPALEQLYALKRTLPEARRPPWKVEVAVVEVAVRYEVRRLSVMTEEPLTERARYGEVEPIPSAPAK